METMIAALLLLTGLAAGAAGAWWLRGRVLAAEGERHRQEVAGLTALRGDIEQNLKALATDALQGSQNSFLALANEAFARHKEGAEVSLDQRQKAIEALLAPINASLDEYRKGIAEIEKSRVAAYSGLA